MILNTLLAALHGRGRRILFASRTRRGRSVDRSSGRTNFEIKPNIISKIDPKSLPTSFKIPEKSIKIVGKIVQNRGLGEVWAALGDYRGVLVVSWGVLNHYLYKKNAWKLRRYCFTYQHFIIFEVGRMGFRHRNHQRINLGVSLTRLGGS